MFIDDYSNLNCVIPLISFNLVLSHHLLRLLMLWTLTLSLILTLIFLNLILSPSCILLFYLFTSSWLLSIIFSHTHTHTFTLQLYSEFVDRFKGLRPTTWIRKMGATRPEAVCKLLLEDVMKRLSDDEKAQLISLAGSKVSE